MVGMASPTRVDDFFTDSYGVTIHYYRWSPKGKPRGVIQLAHGLGEHALRYDDLVKALVDAGYEVWADDHRGHGKTGLEQWQGDYHKLGRLGPGGLRATIAAVEDFTTIIHQQRPDVPLVFLGHSWGSLIGQIILNRGGESKYQGMVLTGTAYRVPGFMNAGDLNAKHKHLGPTGGEWLSRDTAVHTRWVSDPLTFIADTLKLFGPVDAARLIGTPKPLNGTLPLLLMVGSDDSLGGERSALKLAEAYRKAGVRDLELRVYPDARHEVFNEINSDEVRRDLLEWLSTRLPSSRA